MVWGPRVCIQRYSVLTDLKTNVNEMFHGEPQDQLGCSGVWTVV